MEHSLAPRIAFFLQNLDGGGTERVIVRLANTIAFRDIQVDLLIARMIGPWLADLPPDIRVNELGGRGVRPALQALGQYLRRTSPSALLSTSGHANPIATWIRPITLLRTQISTRQGADPTVALGRPVVATQCPIRPGEILATGKFGKPVPVGDTTCMTSGITADRV